MTGSGIRPAQLHRFEQRNYGRFVSIYTAISVLLILAWLAAFGRTSDQWVPAVLLAVAFAFFAWRGRESCVVIQTEHEVSVREVIWTHHLARSRVARFKAEVGSARPWPRSRALLVVELRDGGLKAFKEFSAPATDAGQQEVDRVAAALNAAWNLR